MEAEPRGIRGVEARGYHGTLSTVLSRIGRSALTAWRAREEKGVAFLSADELAARQSFRLRTIARHAWERVPHYRDWMREAGAGPDDLRGAAAFRALPLVDKLALTLDPDRFSAVGYEHRDGLTLLSSETSGRRRFRHDADALFEALTAGRRQRIALRHFVGKETATAKPSSTARAAPESRSTGSGNAAWSTLPAST